MDPRIYKSYYAGLSYVDGYLDLDTVINNYQLAYDAFYESYLLGHAMSGYHLGYLHEIVVVHNIDNNRSVKENLKMASKYYAWASKYCPHADGAYKRIVELAFERLGGKEILDNCE